MFAPPVALDYTGIGRVWPILCIPKFLAQVRALVDGRHARIISKEERCFEQSVGRRAVLAQHLADVDRRGAIHVAFALEDSHQLIDVGASCSRAASREYRWDETRREREREH